MIALVYPNTMIEILHLACDCYAPGTVRVLDLELVTDQVYSEVLLACTQAGWLLVSVDAGAHYSALGTDVTIGVSMGAITVGQRKAIKLKVAIPGGTQVRQRSVGLLIGEGT